MTMTEGPNQQENRRDGEASVRVVKGSGGLVVTKIGKSFKKRPVVRAVSLNLHRGEVVGLLGPNGAGKTTTFYMITGLVPADYGTIELDGHDVTSMPMYRRARMGIGYLPQEASIFRGLTTEENIRATAELVENDPARLESMVEELQQAMMAVGQAVYGGGAGGPTPEQPGTNGDGSSGSTPSGTVEGEYREV